MFNPVDTKTDFAAMERNDIPAKYMAIYNEQILPLLIPNR